MTLAAADQARWQQAPSFDETLRRAGGLLPVAIPKAQRDAGTVSLFLGVRQPDFGSHAPGDLVALAAVHADPDSQSEHCLRSAKMDGPEGNREALRACRETIEREVERALGAATSEAESSLDESAREEIDTWLAFGGTSELSVQRYGYHLGRALHALQDSFTHMFRTADGRRVTHVMNYIEHVRGDLQSWRDGVRHRSNLDDCRLGTPHIDARYGQAQHASRELLDAVGTGTRAERLEALDGVLDRWLTFEAGCGPANDYCDAPELSQPSSGCDAAAHRRSPQDPRSSIPWLFLAACVVAVRRRRRQGGEGVSQGLLVASLVALSTVASAQPVKPEQAGPSPAAREERAEPYGERGQDAMEDRDGQEEGAVPRAAPETATAAAELQASDAESEVIATHPRDEELVVRGTERLESDLGVAVNNGVGFAFGIFGGLDNEVVGARLGVRFPVGDHVVLGLDGEYQAWFSLDAGQSATGAFNAYGTLQVRYAVLKRAELLGQVRLGSSTLLFDYPSADRRSTGIAGGIAPLVLALRLNRALRLVVEPGSVYVSVPKLGAGLPLIHRHHRFDIGLRYTPG